VGLVPEHLRPTVRKELDALVRGERPDALEWVHAYGDHGATLVRQPDDVWDHPHADAVQTAAGGWHVVVPLWTTSESPSDLSAEVVVAADGSATLHNVHVL